MNKKYSEIKNGYQPGRKPTLREGFQPGGGSRL